MSENIKELLSSIIGTIVNSPDCIKINELHTNQAFIFELKVASSDIGKVIGKSGRTARAIRTILESASGKIKKRCMLQIIE